MDSKAGDRAEGMMSSEECQGALGCLEKRRARADLTAPCSAVRGECWALLLGADGRMEMAQSRQDIRKHLFTVRVVRHCNRLPREVVEAPWP